MRDFRDLQVWQKAHQLTLAAYDATAKFPREEIYGLITSHLIYASVELGSSRDGSSRGSSQRIVRNGQPAYQSSVARQTAFRSSNVGDTVAGVFDLVFCFCGCCDGEQLLRSRNA